jgi:hypothetical protein
MDNKAKTNLDFRALLQVGCKVQVTRDKKPYTVKAFDGRYAICTKPFNLKKTVLYFIIDFHENVRGPNNLVFNIYDYAIQEEINNCMVDLKKGELKISHRNRVDLDIISVTPPKSNSTTLNPQHNG